ncbi:MAG TPA: tetratricopeptide repeat protein [Candidatus Acidoferrum sp.]|nr:tetratricopeptide repeat protein [Candidatus Acidoferrum sp.]
MRRTRLLLMTTGLSLAFVRAPAAEPPQNPAPKTSQPATQKLRNPLNDLLDEAQAALDKNDYEAAIPPLQKFIAEKPDVAFAHFQLAYAYTALKRPDDARQEYERSIALDPKMPEAQLNLGVLLLERQPAAAVAALRRAVELLPSESRPRYLLGLAQERSGDFSGAVESFAGATRLDPKDLDSLTRLGQVLLRLGKSADAEGKFRAALELQPNSPEALQGLAQSLDQQKKPQAVDAYRNYLAAEPDDKAARLRLVHLLVEQQKYDEAVAENAKDNAGQPATVDDLKLRADIEINQKKLDEAITTLRRAIALAPNDAQLHGGLGRIYLEKRQFADAEKELKAALELDRNNLAYWKDLSSTYYLAGNCQAALAALDVLGKAEAGGAGTWFIRALCYDKLNQVQPALDAYRKFLELDENKNPDQVWQANQRIHVLEKVAEKKR